MVGGLHSLLQDLAPLFVSPGLQPVQSLFLGPAAYRGGEWVRAVEEPRGLLDQGRRGAQGGVLGDVAPLGGTAKRALEKDEPPKCRGYSIRLGEGCRGDACLC